MSDDIKAFNNAKPLYSIYIRKSVEVIYLLLVDTIIKKNLESKETEDLKIFICL